MSPLLSLFSFVPSQLLLDDAATVTKKDNRSKSRGETAFSVSLADRMIQQIKIWEFPCLSRVLVEI